MELYSQAMFHEMDLDPEDGKVSWREYWTVAAREMPGANKEVCTGAFRIMRASRQCIVRTHMPLSLSCVCSVCVFSWLNSCVSACV